MIGASTFRNTVVLAVGVSAQTWLNPAQDIVLPASSSSASNPLEWLGANSPWFAGLLPTSFCITGVLKADLDRS